MQNDLYLDANATSAVLPAAIAKAEQVMRELYGNPSSTHATGLKAKALLDGVRQCAARVLGAGSGRVVFTSGATESIQTAVLSALCALRERRQAGEATGTVLLYGATEHKAVPESLAHWNRVLGMGLELRALPVDANGLHRLDVLRALAPQTALLCTMAANNETGVVSDIAGVQAVLEQTASRAYWMVDSVQALGKLDLNLAATRIDYAPFSGHKLYAPKGVGLLYVRAGAPFTPLMAGGGQEQGNRAGTENMASIAALGAVLSSLEAGDTFRSHAELTLWRDRLAAALTGALPGIVFNTPFAHALPTTLNFSVPGVASKELLDLFDAAGIRVSSGSACSSAKSAPSYVLEAMGLPAWRTSAAVRMSFGPLADAAFIDAACERIARCGEALRASCMFASSDAPVENDGVIQLQHDGALTWLAIDAASRSCAVIDPQPALFDRIGAYVRCQGVQVRAIVATSADGEAACSILRTLLQVAAGDAPVALGNLTLTRVVPAGANACYLLGTSSAPADVQFAFCGAATAAQLATLVHADTILCASRDDQNRICTTLGAEAAVRPAFGAERHLDPQALEQFLAAHPDAVLIDVREPYEHAANGAPCCHGRVAESVPLSRLAGRLQRWLAGEQRPLVFFCRAGNRSARAAQCAHRLGVANAWQMTGGLALGDQVLVPLPMAA